jgi:two-component system, chemotaxis family, response regulator WspF
MRIAIVNDMVIAVEAMRRVLLNARGHELAWVARDGAEAVIRCAQDTPDLVLMDLIMPEMDGVEATRRIMAETPCAIVVVTANVHQNSSKVFEAMGAGALDAVDTPTLDRPGTPGGSEALLGKIQTISRLIGGEVRSHPRLASLPTASAPTPEVQRPQLIVLGASAGGPAALAKVLSLLPADFPAAIVAVQHVDSQFAEGLARWLDYQTELTVRLAQEGDTPEPGVVLLAGTENHLVFVSPIEVGYTAQPLDRPYHPSVDVCFQSARELWRGDVVGVLLTGMGKDGAAGLKALHDAGHHTIVQDRASSAVYGMPKAAAEIGAASEVLSLEKIAPRLMNLMSHRVNSGGMPLT